MIIRKAFMAIVALCLQGCYSQAKLDAANSVVTAKDSSLKECTKLQTLHTKTGYLYIDSARLDLKMQTAKLGGTHLVETEAIPFIYERHFIEVILSGDAYKCPLGTGPKESSPDALINFDPTKYEYMLNYDTFDDFDEPFIFGNDFPFRHHHHRW